MQKTVVKVITKKKLIKKMKKVETLRTLQLQVCLFTRWVSRIVIRTTKRDLVSQLLRLYFTKQNKNTPRPSVKAGCSCGAGSHLNLVVDRSPHLHLAVETEDGRFAGRVQDLSERNQRLELRRILLTREGTATK